MPIFAYYFVNFTIKVKSEEIAKVSYLNKIIYFEDAFW